MRDWLNYSENLILLILFRKLARQNFEYFWYVLQYYPFKTHAKFKKLWPYRFFNKTDHHTCDSTDVTSFLRQNLDRVVYVLDLVSDMSSDELLKLLNMFCRILFSNDMHFLKTFDRAGFEISYIDIEHVVLTSES